MSSSPRRNREAEVASYVESDRILGLQSCPAPAMTARLGQGIASWSQWATVIGDRVSASLQISSVGTRMPAGRRRANSGSPLAQRPRNASTNARAEASVVR
jgi:hypothetical protein